MVEPWVNKMTGEIYNKHTGLFLGILGIFINCLTIFLHYVEPQILQYISFGLGIYLIPLGIYGSNNSCTKTPMIVNIMSLAILITSGIVIFIL